MRTASPKLDTTDLTANQEAELRCKTALELKDRGEYDAAREALFPLWKGIGSWPDTNGLHQETVPRVLLCAGILSGWLGSLSGIKEADDFARDLITESITLFEALGDTRKVAEARAELGHCYWRAGANAEARIWFSTALERLTVGGNARANALLGLSSVEWAESRYREALRILTENAPLVEKISNHTTKGTYHNQLGIILEEIGAASKNRNDYFQRAIKQYRLADEQFKLARNLVFRGHVKNNLANVLRELRRFKEAHEYLEQARRLFMKVGDKVRVAQVDDTRAQVFIAERKYAKAEMTARSAARSFERAGRECLLAETLVNQGIALARMREPTRAQFIFQEAIEIAHNAGSLNRAGVAALTMLEEIETLPHEVQSAAYEKAREWLASSDSPNVKPRLRAARRRIAAQRQRKAQPVDALEVLFNKRYDFHDQVLEFERRLISETLAKVGGKVTHAAKLLGVPYQYLAFIIETKHPDLIKKRSPVRRRPRQKK